MRPGLLDARLASLEGATGDLVRKTLARVFDNGYVPTIQELESGLRAH